MKTYDYNFCGQTFKVSLEKLNYSNNNSLAVIMMNKGGKFGVVTVNLPESMFLDEDTQFVDTNNMDGIEQFLVENEIATPTGIVRQSGFCQYPAYKFNI